MEHSRTITFFANGVAEYIDEFETHLLKYINPSESRYLITHELGTKTEKPHFHFVVEMDIKSYERFRDAILKKKLNLSAKNKQFGKVNEIRSVNKLLSYCLKDEGPKKTNIPSDEVKIFLEASFKKDKERDHIKDCIDRMADMPYQYEYSDTDILCKKIHILDYFKNKELDMDFRKCDRIWTKYLMKQKHLSSNTVYELMRQTFIKKL